MCRPTDFHTFQLKGRCVEIGDGTPEDVLLCEGQMRGFADGVAPYGNTRAHLSAGELGQECTLERDGPSALAEAPCQLDVTPWRPDP